MSPCILFDLVVIICPPNFNLVCKSEREALLAPPSQSAIKEANTHTFSNVLSKQLQITMKILPTAVLTLLFLQQTACTHLEICECDEIRALVNATVEEAISRLENKFNVKVSNYSELTATFEKLLKPIQQQLNYHLPLPPPPQEVFTESSPAKSCKAIYDEYSDAESGYYWIIKSSGSPVRVYCKMDANCTGYTGGWMRVAYIDMRNSSHQCPGGLSLLSRSSNPRRVCDWTSHSSSTCPTASFSIHGLSYRHVYGRVIAYQNGYPVAFYHNYNSIDQAYVYGASLTHGQNPRKHIWTFAGAIDETSNYYTHKCPCINRFMTQSSSRIPNFIGNDYFCDTSLINGYTTYTKTFYPSNPLWDGQGCGSSNTCCSVSNLCTNSPPWFIKHLPSSTTDNLEMRFCRPYIDGSTPIEVVELYVQ